MHEDLQKFRGKELFRYFQLQEGDEILKTTKSLCADCLKQVQAVVYTKKQHVLICKYCADHGYQRAVLENDKSYYYLSSKDQVGKSYSSHQKVTMEPYQACCQSEGACSRRDDENPFADQLMNKTCTILVEITNACNLSCKVCYANSIGDRIIPYETFTGHILSLLDKKGELDSVQLTGGEASLHPQFWEMVEFLYNETRIKKIYLPTNGIFLADTKFSDKLKAFRKKIIVLLQFDGKDPRSNELLRGARLSDIRKRVMQNLNRLKVPMQLTMTVAMGINEHEIGWVIDMGIKHKQVKVVALQPVTYSGKYEQARDPMSRLTLSDIIKLIEKQTSLSIPSEVFMPIPCSHPNCGWITVYVQRFGITKNIIQYLDMREANKKVAYKALLSSREMRQSLANSKEGPAKKLLRLIGSRLIRSQDSFVIAIKPFMDRFNYDQDRILNCCHHIMNTKGEPVSFCEYNALLRDGDTWNHFPKLA
jgi:7,8-dihydro-6-hydroxymethylpterin dimethyltransferase